MNVINFYRTLSIYDWALTHQSQKVENNENDDEDGDDCSLEIKTSQNQGDNKNWSNWNGQGSDCVLYHGQVLKWNLIFPHWCNAEDVIAWPLPPPELFLTNYYRWIINVSSFLFKNCLVFMCRRCPGVMKLCCTPCTLSYFEEWPYPASRCRYVDVSIDGRIPWRSVDISLNGCTQQRLKSSLEI